MSVPSPWSVKGVPPKAREAAKDLARREGLTLGEWLNRLIGDVHEEGDLGAPRENSPEYSPPNQNQHPSYDVGFGHIPQRDNDNNRLTAALEQLTRRLDLAAAPTYAPQNLTVSGQPTLPHVNLAQPVPLSILDRLEATERRTETAMGRADASLADVRQTQTALVERLRAMETSDPHNKSLAALRGLESALSRLSQQVFDVDARSESLEIRIDDKLSILRVDPTLGVRIGEIEQLTQDALGTIDTSVSLIAQRLDSTEAVVSTITGHLSDALVDLSARMTGAEQSQDNRLNAIDDRLKGLDGITIQAIEGVDKGLGLVSQRVAATEALAQATNERLVEALIDLSARLVQLENMDSKEDARNLLSAIEARNEDVTRRLEVLDRKIDTTRSELTEEVNNAVASGIDGRMAEIAKALADRLDVSERRSAESLERIGAEMARASISLDQRLREIEERGTDDIAASMRSEMAKMANAIDQRMASMERRDATAISQAGSQIQQLAQTLTQKLDASEARAQNSVQQVSSQMEQLAARLQARQDETAQKLMARMEDGEARNHQELQDSLSTVSAEIRYAEDRAKAVSAPLHRDFNAMVSRLDQVEANGSAAYAEAIPFGDQAINISPEMHGFDHSGGAFAYDVPAERSRDAFGSPSQSLSDVTNSAESTMGFSEPTDDFDIGTVTSNFDSFNSTEPDTPRPGFAAPFPGATPLPSDVEHAFDASESTYGATFGNEFDEDPFSMAVSGPKTDTTSDPAFDDFGDEFGDDWSEPARATRGGGADYLTNARNAAARAAAERDSAKQTGKTLPFLGKGKRKPAKVGVTASPAELSGKEQKSKPILSPVGIAAAAALVVTTGIIGINYINRDKGQEDKPAALNTRPITPATASGAPTPADIITGVGEPSDPAPSFLPPNATTATDPKPKADGSSSLPQAVIPLASNQSAEPQRFAAPLNSQARVSPAGVQATRGSASPASSVLKANSTVQLAALPLSVPMPSKVLRPAAVPQIATPATRADNQPRAVASAASRTPTPRVAVAPASRPSSGMTGRQLYDQAVVRQQAGDLAGAASLMRAAADTGDARSINRLAKMYERGEGVTRDPAQARALTERAASRGSRQAMHNLGVYYAEGEGPARDMNKAAENFRRAASKGVTDSQFNLGAMAEQGLGMSRSEREAYYWYAIASRSGDRDAVAKTRELASRLPVAERAAEDQRASQFKAEPSGDD